MHNYLYNGFLVEISELPNELWEAIVNEGHNRITATQTATSQEEAEFYAEELIESWN